MTRDPIVRRGIVMFFLLLPLVGGAILVPDVRRNLYSAVRGIVRPEPPAPITPLAVTVPTTANRRTAEAAPVTVEPIATYAPTPVLLPDAGTTVAGATPEPSATVAGSVTPEPSSTPRPSATHDADVIAYDPSITPEVLVTRPETSTMLDNMPPLAAIDPTLAPLPPIIEPSPTPGPASPTPAPSAVQAPPIPPPPMVEVNGRLYDVYIPAALKEGQQYQYSCEFDAAWVVLQTFGINVSVDELIGAMPIDRSIEPYILETPEGVVIYGGNILDAYSGDYTANFLARSTGNAISRLFQQQGLQVWPVSDRAGIEAALRSGALVWIKTTVDFKSGQAATWIMPDGRTHQTVLGNDHAVVVMGFNEQGVVIRDVLGPTSSNWERPFEYEVDWPTFMAAWGAQSFDGLAVARP